MGFGQKAELKKDRASQNPRSSPLKETQISRVNEDVSKLGRE
jgi:hypothetical protein